MDFAHLDGLMADVDPADRDRIIMLARSIGEPLIAAAAEAAQIRIRAAQRAADIMSRLDDSTAPKSPTEALQSRPRPKAKPKTGSKAWANLSPEERHDEMSRRWKVRRANKASGGQA